MSKAKNEEFVLAKRPEGQHDLKETWKLQECAYPEITKDTEVVCETMYVSVDPYLSSGIKKSALGGVTAELGTNQVSGVVARVIDGKSSKLPVGTVFNTVLAWRRYNLIDDSTKVKVLKKPDDKDNIFEKIGFSHGVGALGMPSQTAYYGARDVGKFQANDVLVISGAAGAVGSILGQICKRIIGCKKVIGVAGGKEKCDLLTKEFGYDAAIDYKEYDTQEKVAKRLQELAGEPITAYFDNTGGHVTDAVFDVIARHGRIVICGQISTYNNKEDKANIHPNYLAKTIYKSLSILGFVVFDFFARNETEFFVDMPKWILDGKVNVRETVLEGFENLPQAYDNLFTGANVGKMVVKVK